MLGNNILSKVILEKSFAKLAVVGPAVFEGGTLTPGTVPFTPISPFPVIPLNTGGIEPLNKEFWPSDGKWWPSVKSCCGCTSCWLGPDKFSQTINTKILKQNLKQNSLNLNNSKT